MFLIIYTISSTITRLLVIKIIYNTSLSRLLHIRNHSYSARANTIIQICLTYIHWS